MNLLKTHPSRKRPPGPKARDLGLTSADAGKGDAPRSNYTEEFRKNFDGINWGMKEPRKPGKTVKVYGPAREKFIPFPK